MTEALVSVKDSADVFEAIEAMRTAGVRRLAVSDAAGTLLGIVSFDDVIAGLGVEIGTLAAVLAHEMESERAEGQRAPVMMAVG